MDLNLHILKEDLQDIVVASFIKSDRLERHLAFARISNNELKFSRNILYIIRNADFSRITDFSRKPSFICVGEPANCENADCDILVCKDNLDPNDILNRVAELFYIYNKWERDMLFSSGKNLPLKTLGELSEPLFGNPIYLHDISLKNLFHIISNKNPVPDYYSEYYDYPELEEINLLKHDKEFISAISKKSPSVYQGDVYRFRSLYVNIFLDKKYSGRLLVDEIFKPFTDKDFTLISIMGEFIKIALEMKVALNLWHPKHLDEIIAKMIAREAVAEKEIKDVLEENGWNMEDSYFCMTIEPSQTDIENKTLASTAIGLSALVPSNCYCIKNDAIIFVFNVKVAGSNQEKIKKLLLPYLRDSFLKTGISACFSDFRNLYYYCEQSRIALRMGAEQKPHLWLYHFDDHVLNYIIETSLRGLLPESLCPEGLLRLSCHDNEHGTDYMHILRVYLENNMHAVMTQQILTMHRNTFYFKLARLREILDMNLEDKDTRLRLLLGFRFLDAE
jgi:sugar diacid utilization regulator